MTRHWTVETLNDAVDAELGALPDDMRARFTRIVELIEGAGLPQVREPHVKHLHRALWEMRRRGEQASLGRSMSLQETAGSSLCGCS